MSKSVVPGIGSPPRTIRSPASRSTEANTMESVRELNLLITDAPITEPNTPPSPTARPNLTSTAPATPNEIAPAVAITMNEAREVA